MPLPVMPLTLIKENARARVAAVCGGHGLVQRLAAMGVYPGAEVTVIRGGYAPGPLVAKVGESGTYSLTAYSIEEVVARDFVVEERPDVVVDVIDASNLERNLYLATQFMEMGVPLVLAFNMSDLAASRGYEVDVEALSMLMKAAIVPTVGHKGKGMAELKDAVVAAASPEPVRPARVTYGRQIERELDGLVPLLRDEPALASRYNARWLAVKLLENDEEVRRRVSALVLDPSRIAAAVDAAIPRIEHEFGEAPEIVIADQRYGFISGACQETARTTTEARHSTSDRIDAVVTSRVLGIPIFLGLMYLMFKLTFTLGEAPMGWIEWFFARLGRVAGSALPGDSALGSLLIDGVIGGVGGVLVFLPNILLLFLAIAILEDSGYMARAAFIMDRLMHKIGLHGKSFIPMLIGFGCTVPAIMATRTLETRRDRLTTMLVLPLMSCGARLPIYTLFIPAFFPKGWQTPVLWSIYIVGIALAVVLAKLLRSTVFKGETAPFVMELPPYRVPTLKGTLMHMWERGWLFVRKAGTIIVGISILLWVFTSYPKPPQSRLEGLSEEQAANVRLSQSVAGRIGHALEPVMKPVGFDWKTTTAMIGAFAAKEVFVAQLGIVHSLGEAGEESRSLREALRREYTPLQAFCIMLFCLISVPCMVIVATVWKESGSWRWASLQVAGLTFLTYLVTLLVFPVGRLVGM